MFNGGSVIHGDDRSLDQNAHNIGSNNLLILFKYLCNRLITLMFFHICGTVIIYLVEPLLRLSDVTDPRSFENITILFDKYVNAVEHELIRIKPRSFNKLLLLILLLLLLFQKLLFFDDLIFEFLNQIIKFGRVVHRVKFV